MNERETHKNTMIEETLYVRCCDSDDSTTAKNICSAKCWFQNSVWFKKLLVVVAGSKQFDRLQKPHWRLHPIDRRTAHKKNNNNNKQIARQKQISYKWGVDLNTKKKRILLLLVVVWLLFIVVVTAFNFRFIFFFFSFSPYQFSYSMIPFIIFYQNTSSSHTNNLIANIFWHKFSRTYEILIGDNRSTYKTYEQRNRFVCSAKGHRIFGTICDEQMRDTKLHKLWKDKEGTVNGREIAV